MKRCHITDRKQIGGADALLECIARNDAAGVDLIQIREKDLDARALCALVARAVSICRRAQVLVNTRVDIALACGAAGTHLPGESPPPSIWRPLAPPPFLFGVSCHSLDEARQAEAGGADFILLAPVFEPLSKVGTGVPLGLDALHRVCAAVRIPVYALGGVTRENAASCMEAGAAGVAGITLFQS